MRNSRATSPSECSFWQASTIRARNASACEVLCRRVHSSSRLLSSVVKMIDSTCGPRRIASPSKVQFTFGHRGKRNVHELMTQDTSLSLPNVAPERWGILRRRSKRGSQVARERLGEVTALQRLVQYLVHADSGCTIRK